MIFCFEAELLVVDLCTVLQIQTVVFGLVFGILSPFKRQLSRIWPEGTLINT